MTSKRGGHVSALPKGKHNGTTVHNGIASTDHNVRRTAALVILLLPTCVVCALCPVGLYRLTNDVVAFVFYLGTVSNFLLGAYKAITIVRRAGQLRQCLERADDWFAASQWHHGNGGDDYESTRQRWRRRALRTSCAMFAIFTVPVGFFSVSPFAFDGATATVRNRDGSYGRYRMNIYNTYLAISSDAVYNRHFGTLYLIELTAHLLYCVSTSTFDLAVVAVCFSICCQLDTIRGAVRSLGHAVAASATDRFRSGPTRANRFKREAFDNNVKVSKEKIDTYSDLHRILTDHQNVLRKIVNFYNIVKPVLMLQIIVSSSSHIFIWFIGAMTIFENDVTESSIMTIKLFIALPVFTFQLFITCYLMESVNTCKDSILFALYSSNWTEMDMQSRKLILLAMSMNNANNLQMRFTKTKIVNLETFAVTMRICYSTCSMLINYNKNKKN